MNKKEIIEDLVNLAIESYNLVLKGNYKGKLSDEVSNHLRKCLTIVDHCTVKEEESKDVE